MQNIVCFKCGERGHVKTKGKAKNTKNERERVTEKEQEKQCSLLGALDAGSFDRSKWCLDSGATSHMCCERKLFTKFDEPALASDGFLRAEGKREVKLQTDLCV